MSLSDTRQIHSEAGYDYRSFMTCDWFDDLGNFILHERSYWARLEVTRSPTLGKLFHYISNPVSVHYWLTNQIYTDPKLAEKESKIFDFIPQRGFYCDDSNPYWFPIFEDFEKAMKFLKEKTGISYESES